MNKIERVETNFVSRYTLSLTKKRDTRSKYKNAG